MKVLFATTFSADLYEGSAKRLLDTFAATKTPGTLVAYIEGMDLPEEGNVKIRRLEADPLIPQFLEANRDIIPKALGGDLASPECKCHKGPFDPHYKKHTLPCPGYWFCKNAFRWFRKPLAVKRAIDAFGKDYDAVIWVDSDSEFVRTIPPEVAVAWFRKRYGCVFVRHKRDAIETGVFGYCPKLGGDRIANAVLDRYMSGKFRKDRRWDDCWQMQMGIDDSKVKALDVATNIGPNNTVLQFSPLGKYLAHHKGHHRRTGKLT